MRALEMQGAVALEASGRVTCWKHAGYSIQKTWRDLYGVAIVVFGKEAARVHDLRCEDCADEGKAVTS